MEGGDPKNGSLIIANLLGTRFLRYDRTHTHIGMIEHTHYFSKGHREIQTPPVL